MRKDKIYSDGKILTKSDVFDWSIFKDIEEESTFKLPALKYPRTKSSKKPRHSLKRVLLKENFLSQFSDENNEDIKKEIAQKMRETEGTHRALTGDVMNRIDSAIGRLCNTDSITKSQLQEDVQKETWKHKKMLPYMRENASMEAIAMKHITNIVLDNEEGFAKNLDETIRTHELLNERKKEVRYRKWKENVFLPTERAVKNTLHKNFNNFRVAKQQAYRDYLTETNVDQPSYLDVGSQYYNGMKLYNNKGVSMKANMPRLIDPIHSFADRINHEQRTIHQCETGDILTNKQLEVRRRPCAHLTGELKPLGRVKPPSEPKCWLMMKFNDVDVYTEPPHDSPKHHYRVKKRSLEPVQMRTTLDLAHKPGCHSNKKHQVSLNTTKRRQFIEMMNASKRIEKILRMSDNLKELENRIKVHE